MKKWIALLIALMMLGCSAAFADTLTMGTNASFPPYEFYDENGQPTGIDVEIARAICEKLGFDSLGYQSIDGLLEAIGIDRDKICTYCWTGKE